MTFAERLTQILDQRHITAYQVSKDIGISNGLLSDWKKGQKSPGIENAQKLANYFDVTVDYLLGRTDDPQPCTTVKRYGEDILNDISNDERTALEAYLKVYREQKNKM